MNTWSEIASILGFFLLRLGIPVVGTALLAWALRRLDARWQAEGEEEARRTLSVEVPPQAILPFASTRPCWEQRNCPDERRSHCPAYAHSTLPCWLVRREVEGAIPQACHACGLFQATGGQAPQMPVSGGMSAD